MSTSAAPNREGSQRARIPRWMGLVLWAVGFPLVHIVLPRGLSLLTPRYGWASGRPGPWNWPGLILVGLGSAIVLWAMALHFARTREGWDWERTPKYLLRQGPYAFTRNPMYLAELVLWLGWALFFGSLAVFLGTLLAWVIFSIVVRREEQAMEARFGEAYRAYQSRVPRWLGRPRC